MFQRFHRLPGLLVWQVVAYAFFAGTIHKPGVYLWDKRQKISDGLTEGASQQALTPECALPFEPALVDNRNPLSLGWGGALLDLFKSVADDPKTLHIILPSKFFSIVKKILSCENGGTNH